MEENTNHLANITAIKRNFFSLVKTYHVGLLVILGLAAILGTSIVVFTSYYNDKAAPNTYIAGVNVSGQTADQIANTINRLVSNIRLSLKHNSRIVTASHDQLGITVDTAQIAATLAHTGRSRLFVSIFTPQKFDLTGNFDRDAVKQFLTKSFPELSTDPVDATLNFDQKRGRYLLKPGAPGRSIKLPLLYKTIFELIAAPKLASYDLVVNTDTPNITAATLQPTVDKLNKIVSNNITINNNGRVIRRARPQDINNWIKLSPDKALKTYAIQYDNQKIAGWVQSVADSLPGKPINARVISSPDGTPYKEISPGKRGQLPTNLNDVVTSLQTAMSNDSITPHSYTLNTVDSDFGIDKVTTQSSHWAEVIKSSYTVNLYDGNNIVATFTQNSIGKRDSPTPEGIMHVTSKVRGPKCMPNPPSQDPLCNINYVTYFTNKGHAFHEAWWLHSGNTRAMISHGCVNMHKDDARRVFEHLSLGDLVYVH